jgi:hypothetical protein
MTHHRTHVEALRLRAPQGDGRTIEPELQRIAAERAAQERHLGPLDEAEHHEALHGRIGGIDRIDADAITGLQIGQCQERAPRVGRK